MHHNGATGNAYLLLLIVKDLAMDTAWPDVWMVV
jgi:hypothetical protein